MTFGSDSYLVDGEEWRAGLPVHMYIPVNAQGQGPMDDSDPDIAEWVCWCGAKPCSNRPPRKTPPEKW